MTSVNNITMAETNLLEKLMILAEVPSSGKIAVNPNSTIYIEEDTKIQALKRYVLGDSRDKTVMEIIKTIREAGEIADTIMDNKYTDIYTNSTKSSEPTDSEVQQHDSNIERLTNIKRELLNSKRGINNLKDTTYSTDQSVVAKLKLALLDIDSVVTKIETKIKKVHTEVLPRNSRLRKWNRKNKIPDSTISQSDNDSVKNNLSQTSIENLLTESENEE